MLSGATAMRNLARPRWWEWVVLAIAFAAPALAPSHALMINEIAIVALFAVFVVVGVLVSVVVGVDVMVAVLVGVAVSVGVGVWQADTDTPWAFRAAAWTAASDEAPAGCPIKGNISANGRIYLMPWSRHYARTKIDTAKGERWFCDENEALAAGWRIAVR